MKCKANTKVLVTASGAVCACESIIDALSWQMYGRDAFIRKLCFEGCFAPLEGRFEGGPEEGCLEDRPGRHVRAARFGAA